MSLETPPQGELLDAKSFLNWATGRLGVAAATDLTMEQKIGVAAAFHLTECDIDGAVRVPELGLTDDVQAKAVAMLLCVRSSQMVTLLEGLLGFQGDGRDFEPTLETLLKD